MKKVILVDDNKDILQLYRTVLNRDYDVDVSMSGETALRRIRSTRYDVLLTDNGLPGISGVDLIRAAREKRPALICILNSGDLTTDLEYQAKVAGAVSALDKSEIVKHVSALTDLVADAVATRDQKEAI
jgi:DNA-binding NtrC family response regulator